MRARTSVVVRAGGVVERLRCEPPLTVRRIRSDDPGTAALCLVGTSAGPLAGDDLTAELRVEDGAAATLVATGASVAQGRRPATASAGAEAPTATAAPATAAAAAPTATGRPAASARWCIHVGEHGRLAADPGALIACEGSRTDVRVDVALADSAAIEWRELVVLGRTTDAAPGEATLRWDVTRAGRPLLRQAVDLTGPHGLQLTAGHRVLASTLLAGPELVARTVVHDDTAVAQRLDAHAVLITVLGKSAAEVGRRLAVLRAEF